MAFLKANGKGLIVGFGVLVVWSTLDWLAAKHGLPFGQSRNYSDTFFGAAAGASAVYLWSMP